MSRLSVAATQMACSWDLPANLDRAEHLIREAAASGAQLILIQELFETLYFCIEQDAKHFAIATTLDEGLSVKRFRALAIELQVVFPFSWFERANRAFYNSLAMSDAGDEILGVYRKSHLSNGPGYQHKTCFNSGDSGLKVWNTHYGHSFIADHTAALMCAADDHSEAVLAHEFDMKAIRDSRDAWGVYRDRRPDLYETISTHDGAARST